MLKQALDRQLVGRILVEIFRGAVDDETELNVAEVMQPIYKLVNDTDANVRQELVEQLPHVAMICQEAPERFGNVFSNHLIRIIVNFHHDDDQQVRQSTHVALLKIIERGLLDKESAEFIVAPTLLRMPLLPAKLEFHRAIDGMSKVASVLDPQTAERLFLNRYLLLCSDDHFFIRKSCAMHFGEFATAMTKETLYKSLLPMYEHLCKDMIWSVRQSCVDAMISVACCVSLEYRRTTLSQILANHLNDASKWVRLSAFQILGPFITTFAKRFTEFTYKQYGELILTDQHGTELRISFLGMGELSASATAASDEEFEHEMERTSPQSKNELALYKKLRAYRRRRAPFEINKNKENIPAGGETSKQQMERTNSWSYSLERGQDDFISDDADESSESHDLYNPFLYYYIPPDLPLDQELIDAATSENKSTNESIENETAENNDNSSENSNNISELTSTNINEQLNKDEMNNEVEETKQPISLGRRALEEIMKVEQQMIRSQLIPDYEVKYDNEESPADGNQFTIEKWKEINDKANNISSELTDENDSITNKITSNVKQVSDVDGQHIVPQVLIDFFVSMADPEAYYDLKWNGVEIPRFCAFCFPAVVLTLGKENWPMLRTAYECLSDAREYRVRRTMASSIHEVAMILGEELSAQDLLPIYDGFIKDLDEVRIGALKHLAIFLKVLKPEDRSQFLPRLQAFLSMDNEWNWRFREEVASQFLQAIPLYTTADVSTHIAPLSFPLLVDKVAAVRQMALKLVTEIVSYLSSDEELVTGIIQELRLMLTAFTSKWTCRQTFALLCASLLKHNAISGKRFARELLPALLKLASDVVPNVRLAVIRILIQIVHIGESLTVEEIFKINQEIEALRNDRDRDVRMVACGFTNREFLYSDFKKMLGAQQCSSSSSSSSSS
ncbi:hypothetical protein PV325_003727 [Microctonus aethiopoides]|nr:hypothetical protein PV325_003727 [Microctonus aethiopoides]KAK0092964.1 hypothetical protein PV326_000229 [Microctonus aethiopoides]